MATREEVKADGCKYYCIACNKAFKQVPTEQYEDGHGGRLLTMCRCGCDLIASLESDKLVNEHGLERASV